MSSVSTQYVNNLLYELSHDTTKINSHCETLIISFKTQVPHSVITIMIGENNAQIRPIKISQHPT